MKKFGNRAFSLVLALAMCLSLLSGISFAAEAQTVDYVYAGDYIMNWGTRDTVATFLSPNAEAFYEDNNTSYEELAALSGASTTSSVPSSALYQELKSLMTSNHTTQTTYDGTRDLYQYTDCQNSGKVSTKISSFYSGNAIGPAWDSGATWNREHTWPNSKGLNGRDEDDIMMLRPTAKSENSSRGNTAYGESTGYYDPNGLGMTLRGDVARIMLYQYIRWGNTAYMWGADGVMESKAVLLKWMEEDPVDTWELGRNDAVESITGTRNVFVDFPELAFLLFNEEIPSDYTTPSGSASTSTYEIKVISSNTAYGTVSLNGKTITASPKAGYEAASYTIVSGQADVTRNGNTFIVTAYSNVTIRINFQALARATVQYAEYGEITGSGAVYKGEDLLLPEPVNTPQEGHTFVGWVTEQVEDTETAPTLYTVGSRFTVTQNQVFYALYSRNESGGSGNSTQFEPYTGTLTAGDYIIVDTSSGNVAMKASVTSKNRLEYSDVTYTNGNILAPAEDVIWRIEPSGSYWTIYNAAKGAYAAGTGTKNTANLKTAVNTYTQWIAARQSSGTFEFTNVAHKNAGINPLLRRNGTVGFACYATNTNVGGPLHLYKRAEGTVYYFTQLGEAACLHPDAHDVSTVYPECDSVGYTAGVYCPDCDEYLSGHEEIPAINHQQAYKEEGKAPTCTEAGYADILYCPDCDEYLEEQVTLPATGHNTVNGLCLVCGVSEYDVLVLTEDTGVELSLTEDLYVDLKGYDLTGTIVLNGYKVYGMDTTTDSYTCANIGSFSCADENGAAVEPERICAYGEKQYLAIDGDEGYSFHRFFVGITHMSLEPEVVGLGYKAAVYGDEMVFAQLAETKAVSFRLQLEGYNSVYRYFDSSELADREPIALRIRNYDVENYSEHALAAQVSLTLADGTVIETEQVSFTFRWLTEQINENHTDYTADQLAQFGAMLQKFAVVKSWDISNLI